MSSTEATYGHPETRGRILEAAWELVEARGSAIRLGEAAERANVSRQALYLHFGDRSGLLVALVQFVDESLGSAELKAHMWAAPTGSETLRRWIDTLSTYTASIDTLTRVLEAGQYEDEALSAAWRDRMRGRRAIIRKIVDRLVAGGELAPGCAADTAVDLIYAVTMPGLWRELVREQSWTSEEYAQHVFAMLRRGLLAPGDGCRLDTA